MIDNTTLITKLNTAQAKQLQTLLNNKGYTLTVDGIVGPKTTRAFRRFKEKNNLAYPEYLGKTTLMYLQAPTQFITPAKGRISSYYGWRTHPISGKRTFHKGIDIANNTGTPIKATHKGQVIKAGHIAGYGNTIIIKHKKYKTLYAHCDTLLVKQGKIEQGETIALMGSTGHSTGPHLHFELHINNNPTNPMNYLNK